MSDIDAQHCESSANALACYLSAVQGDRAGLAIMLDAMGPQELRGVATAALFAAAEANRQAAPSQRLLDRTTEFLKAKLAELRAQAMK